MKRTFALLVAVISAAASLSACSSTGEPTAAKVDSTKISRVTLDDELRTVSENKALTKSLTRNLGTNVTPSDGGVSTKLSTLWITTLVNQTVVDRIFKRRHLTVTAKNRANAKKAVEALYGSAKTFNQLPRSFRDVVLGRQDRFEAVKATLPKAAPPTDAQLQQMLGQSKASLCPSGQAVAHIELKTKAEADAVEAELAQGADFGTLAKQRSADTSSGSVGGLVACTASDQYKQLPAAFRAGADLVALGSVSPPVQTSFGYHVIKVEPFNLATTRALLTRLYVDNLPNPMTLFINNQLVKSKVWVDPRYGKITRSKTVFVIAPPVAPNPPSRPNDSNSTTTTARATGQ